LAPNPPFLPLDFPPHFYGALWGRSFPYLRERGILLSNASILVLPLTLGTSCTAFDCDFQASVGIEKLAQIVHCTTAEFIVEYFKRFELSGKYYGQD
jgi:hypothetical protein